MSSCKVCHLDIKKHSKKMWALHQQAQICTNPTAKPEKWKFKKINDVIHQQHGFKTWRDARNEWGEGWIEQRYDLAAKFAFASRDNVYSERQPDKPTGKYLAELAKSKKKKKQNYRFTSKGL